MSDLPLTEACEGLLANCVALLVAQGTVLPLDQQGNPYTLWTVGTEIVWDAPSVQLLFRTLTGGIGPVAPGQPALRRGTQTFTAHWGLAIVREWPSTGTSNFPYPGDIMTAATQVTSDCTDLLAVAAQLRSQESWPGPQPNPFNIESCSVVGPDGGFVSAALAFSTIAPGN